MAFLTPYPAIAKVRDFADTVIQRNTLFAAGLIGTLLALSITDFDIGQRKVVSVEQLGHFCGRQQGFGLGAAIVCGFGAQTLDSSLESVNLESVKGGEVRKHGHGHRENCSTNGKGG